jgi:NADPH2:quinone reductase
MNEPRTMRTIRYDAFGPPEVLKLVEVPVPQPGPGQVLIRVDAAGVNLSDVLRRRDDPYPFPTELPHTPGAEAAGSIAALGAGVDGPPIGTPVFALVGDGGTGGYAQYALAYAAAVVPIPDGIDVEAACAMSIAGTTALLILRDAARLRPGEHVLVEAAAGGVGSYAVQLARLMGAGSVIAAASTEHKREAALQLGADHAVDPHADGWAEEVRDLTGGRGVDVILEMCGGRVFAEALTALAPFGRVVVYGNASREGFALDAARMDTLFVDPALNASLIAFNLGVWFQHAAQGAVAALTDLVAHVVAGDVEVQLGERFPLSRAADAHRLLESRASTGNLILRPWV